MLGDLSGSAMKSLGSILERAKEEVSAIDVSNVPGYFAISKSHSNKMKMFTENIQALPLQKDSVLLFSEETKWSKYYNTFKDKGRWFYYCLPATKLSEFQDIYSDTKPLQSFQRYIDENFESNSNSDGRLRIRIK